MDAFFVFKRTVGMLLQPVPVFLLIVAAAAVSRLFGRKRLAVMLLVAGSLLIALCSLPILARRLALPLERRYPVMAAAAAAPAAIVILGSGVAHPDDPALPALTRLSDTARARLIEGIRLAMTHPDAAILTCGYGLGLESCADATAEAAAELGIPPERITRLSQAMDTAHEAALTRETLGRGVRVAVVTSAVHMPRAMELFRREGLDAVAAPCDFTAPASDAALAAVNSLRWQPGAEPLVQNARTWHEAIGLIYTRYLCGEKED